LKSTHYSMQYHRLQGCDRQADTWVRFPSSRASFRVFRRPVCTIFKSPYSHFYTWAEFWTSDYLRWLLRLQVCYRQVDTCVGFPSLRVFLRAFERPIPDEFKFCLSHSSILLGWFTGDGLPSWLPFSWRVCCAYRIHGACVLLWPPTMRDNISIVKCSDAILLNWLNKSKMTEKEMDPIEIDGTISIYWLPGCRLVGCLTKRRVWLSTYRKLCMPSYIQYGVFSGRANALLTVKTTWWQAP